jgi:hypothetical protein
MPRFSGSRLPVLAIALVAAALPVMASDGTPAAKLSVTSGGGRVAGGPFVLDASIGQIVAGDSSGGSYSLRAGLLPEAKQAGDAVFANGFE